MANVLENLLNSGLDNADNDPMLIRKFRMVNLLTLGLMILGTPLSIQHWLGGVAPVAVAIWIGITLGFFNLYLLRKTKHLILCGNLTVIVFFGIITTSNFLCGGFFDPNFSWLYIIPMLAGFLINAKAFWIYTGLVLLTMNIFFVLPMMGYTTLYPLAHHEYLIQSYYNRIFPILIMAFMVSGFLIERHKSEEALKNAKIEAEEANIAKTTFLAKMSHEIRTPMNGILGMTEVLEETELNENQKDYLRAISYSGESLLTVLNDILDFSKIEAGKLELESQVFSPTKLYTHVIELFQGKAGQRGINLILEIDENVPTTMVGDGARVRQVLMNLISNAIKFTHQGTVQLRLKMTKETDETIQLYTEVIDSGIGIRPESIDKVFELFSQAERSTTRKFGGTGLGLTIVKQLVELMNGKIGVKSSYGNGSMFWFTTLFTKSPSSYINNVNTFSDRTNRKNFKEVKRHYGGKILVAEDNKVNQILVEKHLSALGCHVDIVTDGHEVLSAIDKGEYDLIIMDCHMPNLDGYAATEAIRKKMPEPLSSIPIIALTASAMGGDREKCLSSGMNDYISKPFKKSDLVNVLHRWLKPKDTRRII